MQRLVCVAVVWAASAEAHAQACPDAVSGWVADASEASGVRMEAVACPPGMARVRLFPEGARPIDVEVAETEGPSFRRAGRLRTSPIVDVPDYGTLPEAQRDAYDALVRWLAENDARVRFGAGPAALREATELSGPGLRDAGWWLLGAAVLLAAMALALARPGAFEWREPLVLLGVGLAARVGFGVWGPLHVNGQGPLWIRGALEDPGMLASYGPGYPELFGPIARALTPDSAIFATNAALSALIPVVVYGIARAHELDRNRALLAALLLTLDPVSIRFATSESYFTPVVFLVSAAALGSSLSGRMEARAPRILALLASALLCAHAARIHPVAWLPIALVPLFALPRPVAAIAAFIAIPATLWLTGGAWISAILAQTTAHGPGADVLARAMSSGFPTHALVSIVVGAAALYVARPRRLVAIGLAYALVALATRHAYGQSDAWQASYDRLFAPFAVPALAAIAPHTIRLRASIAIPTVFAAALLAASVPLLRTTTEQREHAFLREALAEVPPECRIAYVARRDRRIVEIPTWAHPGDLPPIRIERPEDLHAANACTYFVHTSICTTAEARSLCEAIPRGDAIASRTFDAVPSYDGLPYDRARVPVSIHTASTRPP